MSGERSNRALIYCDPETIDAAIRGKTKREGGLDKEQIQILMFEGRLVTLTNCLDLSRVCFCLSQYTLLSCIYMIASVLSSGGFSVSSAETFKKIY